MGPTIYLTELAFIVAALVLATATSILALVMAGAL
jgi:hypothetical protein